MWLISAGSEISIQMQPLLVVLRGNAMLTEIEELPITVTPDCLSIYKHAKVLGSV